MKDPKIPRIRESVLVSLPKHSHVIEAVSMLAQSSWRSVRSVLGMRARLFSVLSDAFDVSLNSSSWPQPLRSSFCNTITAKNLNQTVTVSGWVDSIRVMKDSVFVVVRDGEGAIQTLFDCDKDGLALQHG